MNMHLSRVTLVGFSLLLGSSLAQAISIYVNPSSQQIGLSDTTSVDVMISDLREGDPRSLSAFDLDLRFKPRLLGLDNIVLDPGGQLDVLRLGGNFVFTELTNAGKLRLVEISLDKPSDLNARQGGEFSLATLTFRGLAGGTSELRVVAGTLGDAFGEPLSFDAQHGAITVVPEPPSFLMFSLGIAALALRRRK